MDERWSHLTDVRQVNLDDIRDGDLVAVIVRDTTTSEEFRVAAYCTGAEVPDSVAAVAAGGALAAPCICGAVGLVYRGHSHRMPEVFQWPTLVYGCPACGAEVSFLRLSAADARRALRGGLGVSTGDAGS